MQNIFVKLDLNLQNSEIYTSKNLIKLFPPKIRTIGRKKTFLEEKPRKLVHSLKKIYYKIFLKKKYRYTILVVTY